MEKFWEGLGLGKSSGWKLKWQSIILVFKLKELFGKVIAFYETFVSTSPFPSFLLPYLNKSKDEALDLARNKNKKSLTLDVKLEFEN